MHRTVSSLALVAVAVAVAVAAGAADAATPTPARPMPSVLPKRPTKPVATLSALTIERANKLGGAAYAGSSPLAFEVEVANAASVAADTTLVVTELFPTEGVAPRTGGELAKVRVNVPATGRANVTYELPHGPDNACTPTYHRLSIAGSATSKTVEIAPSCSFGVTTPNPYAGQMPDRVYEARKNKVSYEASALDPMQVRCNAPLFMRAKLVNDRQADTAHDVFLTLENPRGEVYPGLPSKHDLAPKVKKDVSVESLGFHGEAGRWTLRLHAARPEWVHQPAFAAVVTRTCSIQVKFVAAVPRLAASPR